MNYKAKSIRTFIGSKDFSLSQRFYKTLGFQEFPIDDKMSYFKVDENMGFYLQAYYKKEWVNNTMIFLEVDDLDQCEERLLQLDLVNKFKIKQTNIKNFDWGRELFMHDPAGNLWHFGEFKGLS